MKTGCDWRESRNEGEWGSSSYTSWTSSMHATRQQVPSNQSRNRSQPTGFLCGDSDRTAPPYKSIRTSDSDRYNSLAAVAPGDSFFDLYDPISDDDLFFVQDASTQTVNQCGHPQQRLDWKNSVPIWRQVKLLQKKLDIIKNQLTIKPCKASTVAIVKRGLKLLNVKIEVQIELLKGMLKGQLIYVDPFDPTNHYTWTSHVHPSKKSEKGKSQQPLQDTCCSTVMQGLQYRRLLPALRRYGVSQQNVKSHKPSTPPPSFAINKIISKRQNSKPKSQKDRPNNSERSSPAQVSYLEIAKQSLKNLHQKTDKVRFAGSDDQQAIYCSLMKAKLPMDKVKGTDKKRALQNCLEQNILKDRQSSELLKLKVGSDVTRTSAVELKEITPTGGITDNIPEQNIISDKPAATSPILAIKQLISKPKSSKLKAQKETLINSEKCPPPEVTSLEVIKQALENVHENENRDNISVANSDAQQQAMCSSLVKPKLSPDKLRLKRTDKKKALRNCPSQNNLKDFQNYGKVSKEGSDMTCTSHVELNEITPTADGITDNKTEQNRISDNPDTTTPILAINNIISKSKNSKLKSHNENAHSEKCPPPEVSSLEVTKQALENVHENRDNVSVANPNAQQAICSSSSLMKAKLSTEKLKRSDKKKALRNCPSLNNLKDFQSSKVKLKKGSDKTRTSALVLNGITPTDDFFKLEVRCCISGYIKGDQDEQLVNAEPALTTH